MLEILFEVMQRKAEETGALFFPTVLVENVKFSFNRHAVIQQEFTTHFLN